MLEQFKLWMEEQGIPRNPWYNDTLFLRFCRARKFDFEKIKLMFQNYIAYREEYGVDDIVTVSSKSNSPKIIHTILLIFYFSRDLNLQRGPNCSRIILGGIMVLIRLVDQFTSSAQE